MFDRAGLDMEGEKPPVIPQQASNEALKLQGQSQSTVYGQVDFPQQHYRKSLGETIASLPDSSKQKLGI